MASRKPTWKRWLRRFLWTLAGFLVLLLLALAIPWSPSALERRIAQELTLRLGCPVEIEQATLWPLWGQITLRNVKLDYSASADRFRFTEMPRPEWTLREAVVSVPVDELLRRRRPASVDIVLRKPDRLLLGGEGGRFTVFPPLPEIIERQTSIPSSGQWRLSSLSLDDGNLTVTPSATGGPEKRQAVLSQVHCTYTTDLENAAGRLAISGRIGAKASSSFQAQIVQRGSLWTLRLDSEPIRFGADSPGADTFWGTTDDIHLHGQLQRQRTGNWTFHLDGKSPRIALLGVTEEATSLSLRGNMDDRTSRGVISLEVASRQSRASASADLALDGSRDSQTTVTIERLAQGWFDLWNQRRSSQWPTIAGRQERLTVTATALLHLGSRTGKRSAGESPASHGPEIPWVGPPQIRVALAGVNLASDYLPFTVHDVDFEAAAAPGLIEIRRCRGRWARGWVSLHGTHQGVWWNEWGGTTRLAWAFALRAEDLLTTLPAKAETGVSAEVLDTLAHRPLVAGDLAGSGTLVLGWERSRRPTAPTTKTLQGAVTLRHGRITHPALPAPVTDLDGAFDISPERLRIGSMRGEFSGSTATISAAVEGEPFFWVAPQARCLIHTDVAVAEALRLAPKHLRATIAEVEPRGDISAEVSLAGPLRQPFRQDDIAATGTLLFRNVAFRSPSWAVSGTFHDIQGRVELAEGVFRLTTATGQLNHIPFSLQAEAAPEANRFFTRLETSAPFVAFQEAMPRALGRYEVGGDLSGWFEFDASGHDLFKEAGRVRELTSETIAQLPFPWGLRGELTVRDGQLTFETFPTSLTAINGRVSLKNFEWTFEDMTSSWGKTEKCKIGGGGRFRPGSWPKMQLALEAPVLYLDEWIRPWRRSRGSRFPPRPANPVFELSGTLRGPRAFYRGHPGENFSGEFDLVSPHRQPDMFRFSNMSVNMYGGRLSGQGSIEFQHGDSTCSLQLAAQNVSLPPLLQCESGREQTFVGHLTGNSSFYWLNGEAETLTARGHLAISDSKFWGNIFFRKLGRLIRIPVLDDISFATIEAPFQISRQRVICENLAMDGSFMSMTGRGSVGFDHSLDFMMEVSFPHLPQYVRPLDFVVQSVGKLPANALSLDLRGSWDDPEYGFHHLDAAEEGLLDALGRVWNIITPGSPTPPPKPLPDRK